MPEGEPHRMSEALQPHGITLPWDTRGTIVDGPIDLHGYSLGSTSMPEASPVVQSQQQGSVENDHRGTHRNRKGQCPNNFPCRRHGLSTLGDTSP